MIRFGEEHRRRNFNRIQYKAVELLSGAEKGKVLDCGSGLGEFSIMLKDIGNEVVCIDGNEEFVEKTRELSFESYCVDLETGKFPFHKEQFDGVVCLEVIEHICNVENLLKEIARVLRPNGWLLISTPNNNYWGARIKRLLGLSSSLDDQRHKRFYVVKTIREELNSFGFRAEDYLGMCKIPQIGTRLATKLFSNLLSFHIAFRCKKF